MRNGIVALGQSLWLLLGINTSALAAPLPKAKVPLPKATIPATPAPAVVAPMSPRVEIVDAKGQAIKNANVVVGGWDAKNEYKVLATFKAGAKVKLPALSSGTKRGWILASTPGKTIEQEFWTPTTRVVRLVLHPSQSVRLRFVDVKNAPLNGVSVRLIGRYQRHNSGSRSYLYLPKSIDKLPFPLQTRSDAQGWTPVQFGRKNDTVVLWVEKAGFQSIPVNMSVSDEEGLTVRLVPESRISGQIIRGDSGKPLKNAHVEFTASSSSLPNASDTNAQGHFLISGIDETLGFVRLKDDKLVLPARVWTTKRGETLKLGNLKATPGCVVTGTVSRADKKPLMGELSVWLQPQTPNKTANGSRPYKALSLGEKGEFSLRLPPGRFVFRSSSWQGQQLTVEKTFQATEGGSAQIHMVLKKSDSRSIQRRRLAQARLQAERQEYLTGEIVDRESGKPVPGVRVRAYGNGQEVASNRSNSNGLFALGPLPIVGQSMPSFYTVIADAQDGASAPTIVAATSEKNIKLTLEKGKPLEVRAVTNDGKPVEGVTVSVRGFRFSEVESGRGMMDIVGHVPFFKPGAQAQTDANGIAVLPGLPSSGFVELKTFGKEFADGIYSVALTRTEPAKLQLVRPTVIRGRVTLAGGRPVPAPGLNVKMQGFSYPWGEQKQWRTSAIGKDGSYEIGNVPSLEHIGEDTYCINIDAPGIDMNREREVAPGVSLSYVNGWNLLLTIKKDGKKERWIAFVEAGGKGLRFKEGEQVNHDIEFQPLAVLKGTLPKVKLPQGRTGFRRRSISYQDPRSIYGSWGFRADAQGKFEILVPVGSVTVNFPDGNRKFSDLKPHEVRVVDWAAQPKISTASPRTSTRRSGSSYQDIQVRVLGPDGVTVPRPSIKCRLIGDRTQQLYMPFSGEMDGTMRLLIFGPGPNQLEITSLFLDKPLVLTTTTSQTFLSVRLSRVPNQVPPDPDLKRTPAR